MPCYQPIEGWRSRTINESGKRSIVFNLGDGYPDLPVSVPCGQCIGCRLERSRQWAMRCVHEAQLHVHKCFLTLTYDDDKLPPNNSLRKTDFTKFMKRLRKAGHKVRYFHCGEYGDNTNRPHYHALIYGYDFPDKTFYTRNPQGDTIYRSEELNKLWGLGLCTIGNLTFETAAYTARYCLKKVNGEAAESHYNGREPEYITMSLKPTIGLPWYEKFKDDCFPSDFLTMRGKAMPPPRMYLRKLEASDPKLYKRVKRQRVVDAHSQRENNTSDRLRVRATVAKARISTFSRTL